MLVRAHAHAVADLPPVTVTAGAASRSLVAEGRGEEKGGDRGRKMGKRRRAAAPVGEELTSPVNSLDDGCLMHIFSFLSPIPGSICSSNLTLTPHFPR